MAFAEKLIAVRRAHHLTQEQLAAKLFVTRQAISRWERGEVTPGIDMMKLIAAEARARYGDEAIDAANEALLDMDPETWNDMKELERAILGQLSIAVGDGDPESNEARKLVAMHRRWIGLNWGHQPQDEAYLGLAHGYLADQRFIDYYDKPCGTGATAFLVQAIESSLTRA